MDEQAERVAPEVPDFEMIRPVGSGGCGEVWLASNRTTGYLRAVKVIPLQQSGRGDPAGREIGSLTRLEAHCRCHHPHLMQIHHVGKTANYLFYVMDAADDVSGTPASDILDYRPATLQTRLQSWRGSCTAATVPEGRQCNCHPNTAPPSPEIYLDYARQLLSGLAALHAAGMVHRDVKPANCLFVGGQLKLADFGLLTEAHPLVSRVGTRQYMPPDGRMDMRADVYAAGLVIYELLSGSSVEEFPRLGDQSRRVGDDPILSGLLRLVLRACEREPEKRFPDARAMLAELDRPARTSAAPARRRAWGALAAVLLAAAGLSAWALWPRGVEVSFISDPFEAKIYLDDTLLVDSDGTPYTTPCTVEGLAAGEHRVAFACPGLPRWEAGAYNFAEVQQIVSQQPK
jgi:eukaryotic-like serine/threonine-protein kinase